MALVLLKFLGKACLDLDSGSSFKVPRDLWAHFRDGFFLVLHSAYKFLQHLSGTEQCPAIPSTLGHWDSQFSTQECMPEVSDL